MQTQYPNIGQGKSLILVMPEDMGISDILAKQLTLHGFDVIYYKRPPFHYKNTMERLVNFYRKTILKDKSYKEKQQEKLLLELLLAEIKKRNKIIDYALFIRADYFEISFIETIKSHVNLIVNEQWDGLERYPQIFSRIHPFDRFFVFDKSDIKKYPQYDFKFISNFYFENKRETPVKDKKQVYFLGSHLPQRTASIVKFLEVATQCQLEIHFFISCIDKRPKEQALYAPYPVHFIKNAISFEENIKLAQQTDILVDFTNYVHQGLSFRVFESIGYRKKLITNNIDVVNYDFYHPNNIFVWQGEELTVESFQQFLDLPYIELSQEIIKKYSFENWVKYLLNIPPYIEM